MSVSALALHSWTKQPLQCCSLSILLTISELQTNIQLVCSPLAVGAYCLAH